MPKSLRLMAKVLTPVMASGVTEMVAGKLMDLVMPCRVKFAATVWSRLFAAGFYSVDSNWATFTIQQKT